MLLRHPPLESHSSTTRALTVRPLSAVMRIALPHLFPPAYHREDSATIRSSSLWNRPSHDAAPPPSSPRLKPFTVITAGVPSLSWSPCAGLPCRRAAAQET
ncbi:hypothetical protein Zm00014a_004913 [Zea mays]|uniref:Uncharacterized protein n=1 Tax=Zea mays TaxID=4577 RepID=A0A317YC78_MAIZE|nr:hypothetical protein Zm00014a_004913 [Zea mays]